MGCRTIGSSEGTKVSASESLSIERVEAAGRGGGRRMKEREGERENERVSEGGREIYNTAITGTVHTRIIITSCMA